METLPESIKLYGIYDSEIGAKCIFNVYSTLEEAKQELEVLVIENYNTELDNVRCNIRKIGECIDAIELIEKKRKEAEKPPKKQPAKKQPAKKQETESESGSDSESYGNSYDSVNEYRNMSRENLLQELAMETNKRKNKYEILKACRSNLKILSFTIEE